MQEIDTLGRLFDAAQDTRLERKSEGLIVVREGLATLLGCTSGESWLRVAGLRWHVERNIKLCWTEIFVARKYADVRKHVTDQTAGIFTLLERHFGVTLTRLEQEISAVAIDDKHAAELDADAGKSGPVRAAPLFRSGRRIVSDRDQPLSGRPLHHEDAAAARPARRSTLIAFGA